MWYDQAILNSIRRRKSIANWDRGYIYLDRKPILIENSWVVTRVIHVIGGPLIPQRSNFIRSFWWSTRSNTFEKSMQRISIAMQESRWGVPIVSAKENNVNDIFCKGTNKSASRGLASLLHTFFGTIGS